MSERMEVARWEVRRHSEALGSALDDWDALPSCSWGDAESDPGKVRLLDRPTDLDAHQSGPGCAHQKLTHRWRAPTASERSQGRAAPGSPAKRTLDAA
jgi:hypothetical protein